jgi:hypothetical protein
MLTALNYSSPVNLGVAAMGDQFEILTTLFEFFAFSLLVVVGGAILFVLLVWWDEATRELMPKLPSKSRRRRAAIPITKIA